MVKIIGKEKGIKHEGKGNIKQGNGNGEQCSRERKEGERNQEKKKIYRKGNNDIFSMF